MAVYGFERGVMAGLIYGRPEWMLFDAVLCFDFSDELHGRALEFVRGLTVPANGRVVFQQMKNGAQDTDCRADGPMLHDVVTTFGKFAKAFNGEYRAGVDRTQQSPRFHKQIEAVQNSSSRLRMSARFWLGLSMVFYGFGAVSGPQRESVPRK
jgi:hypothetical protein